MAELTKVVVPIDLGQGVDSKTGAYQIIETKLSELKNREFTKVKELNKTPGFEQLTTDIRGGGSLSENAAITSYNDELVTISDRTLYSYDSIDSEWINKGEISHIKHESFDITNGASSVIGQESAHINGAIVLAWMGEEGALVKVVRADNPSETILDETLINDVSGKIKLVELSSTLVGIYYNDGALIKYRTIASTDLGVLTSEQTLGSSSAIPAYGLFDTVQSSSYNAIIYPSTSSTTITAIKLDADGSESTSSTTASGVPFNSVQSLSGVIDTATGNLFVCFASFSGTTRTINSFILDSSLSSVQANTSLETFTLTTDGLVGIIGYISATNTVNWLFEAVGFQGDPEAPVIQIYSRTFDTSATIGPQGRFHDDIGIASKAFIHNSRNYAVFVCADRYQGNYYVIDLDSKNVYAVMRTDLGGLTFDYQKNLPYVSSSSTDQFFFPSIYKSSTILDQEGFQLVTSFIYSIGVESLGMGLAKNEFAVINDVLHITGGVTKIYDGDSVSELGFYYYPFKTSTNPIIEANLKPFSLVQNTSGTAGTPEVFSVLCSEGRYLADQDYFSFFDAADANEYFVYFNVVPAGPPSGTGILVNVYPSDSSADVANKIASAVNSEGIAIEVTKSGSDVIVFTNTANGNSTAPSFSIAGNGFTTTGTDTRTYAFTYEFIDSKGNIYRSSQSRQVSVNQSTWTLGISRITGFSFCSISDRATKSIGSPTLITDNFFDSDNIFQIYRTVKGGGTIFYKGGQTRRLYYDGQNTTAYLDYLPDDDIDDNETIYTTGGILENKSTVSSTNIHEVESRVFIISSGDVFYSKNKSQGFGLSFNDGFIFASRERKDRYSRVWVMDGNILLFSLDHTFVTNGPGPNDSGLGSFYPEPRLIPTTMGAKEETSLVLTKNGLFVKSKKGLYLITRSLEAVYLGAEVEQYNDDTVLSADVLTKKSQVRFLLDSGVFIFYDYEIGQWGVRDLANGVDATIWKDRYVVARSDGTVWAQDDAIFQDNGVNVPTTLETGWMKLGQIQGYKRFQDIIILGRYKSPHKITVKIGYDFVESYLSADTYTFTPGAVNPVQFKIKPRVQKAEAIRIRIEDDEVSSGAGLLEGNTLTNISLNVGVKKGLQKLAEGKNI